VTTTGSGLTGVVTRYLEANQCVYAVLDDGSLVFSADGRHGRWRCRMFVDEEREQVACYSILPQLVPAGRRSAVTELITRVNVLLVLGNFELDLDRGELRYKTSIDVEGDRLTEALLTHLVRANIWTMDRYVPSVARVVRDGADPADAAAEIPD
jgi:hypothetical protein